MSDRRYPPSPAQRSHAPTVERPARSLRTRWVVGGVACVLVAVAITAGGVILGRHLSSPPASPTQSNHPPAQAPTASSLPAITNAAPSNLAADFAQLQAQIRAPVGIAVTAVGSGQPPIALGDLQGGSAWSTIKVPLTIAALREENPPTVTATMKAAITESDNAAAETIWDGLGDPIAAAHKVEAVLRESGDPTTVEFRKLRPEFTAFGQTDWSLANQAKFVASAVCDPRNAPIFALMGQVVPEQSWGIGTLPGSPFKGGWGPSPTGRYLVRQIGTLTAATGTVAVAIAVGPASGSFADGTQALTDVAQWLHDHLAALPAGNCRT
ncbi:MAG TPA: hypothetical protein VH185_02955 [Mycobacterium sp.]|nr:hypothetical protein [Mycobacterium sp.]